MLCVLYMLIRPGQPVILVYIPAANSVTYERLGSKFGHTERTCAGLWLYSTHCDFRVLGPARPTGGDYVSINSSKIMSSTWLIAEQHGQIETRETHVWQQPHSTENST